MEQHTFYTTRGMLCLEHLQICKPNTTCKTACCITLLYIVEEATEKIQFVGTAPKYVSLCEIATQFNGTAQFSTTKGMFTLEHSQIFKPKKRNCAHVKQCAV